MADFTALAATMYSGNAPASAPAERAQQPTREESLVAALWPAPKEEQTLLAPAQVQEEPNAHQDPDAPDRLAKTLFGGEPEIELQIPEHIAQLRKENASSADALYGDTPDSAIAAHLAPVVEAGYSEGVHKAVSVELTRIAGDLGLDQEGIRTLISRGALPEVREMTPEQVTANHVEARRLLAAEFGDQAERALDDAKKFAARDPRVRQMLNSSGLGDDPTTILQFARLAARQRASAKPK